MKGGLAFTPPTEYDHEAVIGQRDCVRRMNAADVGMARSQQEPVQHARVVRKYAELHDIPLAPEGVIPPTLSAEERSFSKYVRDGSWSLATESRDLSIGVGSAGGYLVPPAWLNRVIASRAFSTGLLSRVGRWDSAGNGNAAKVPLILADLAVVGSPIAENVQATDTNDIASGAITQVSFPLCPTIGLPGLLKLGRGLVADAGFPVESMLREAMAWRVSRRLGLDAVTALAGSAAVQTTTASPTAITVDDLIAAEFSVGIAARGNGVWLVSPALAKAIAGLKDSSLRPIQDAGATTREVETASAADFGGSSYQTTVGHFRGHPVVEDINLGTLAATNTVGYFLDAGQALLMRTVSAELLTLVETFSDAGQVAWIGFFRAQVVATDAVNAAARITMHA